jgi:hypothetical protein
MEISRKIGHSLVEGEVLYHLALMRSTEGRTPEALEFARQAITIWEKVENPQLLERSRKLVRELEQQLQEQSDLVSTKE